MSSNFHDMALLNEADSIRIPNGAEAMCYDDGGLGLHLLQPVDGLLDNLRHAGINFKH